MNDKPKRTLAIPEFYDLWAVSKAGGEILATEEQVQKMTPALQGNLLQKIDSEKGPVIILTDHGAEVLANEIRYWSLVESIEESFELFASNFTGTQPEIRPDILEFMLYAMRTSYYSGASCVFRLASSHAKESGPDIGLKISQKLREEAENYLSKVKAPLR